MTGNRPDEKSLVERALLLQAAYLEDLGKTDEADAVLEREYRAPTVIKASPAKGRKPDNQQPRAKTRVGLTAKEATYTDATILLGAVGDRWISTVGSIEHNAAKVEGLNLFVVDTPVHKSLGQVRFKGATSSRVISKDSD
ncbi:hypothetical protein [uncultured Microbacterium sp.]|uniref:hypothetical protein n=1 Tax=uncultured Microbacterium sp. TaxID=191216 RepID=UPI0028E63058|nr:hypothetical protein [uncultured Microbacterium sp.]